MVQMCHGVWKRSWRGLWLTKRPSTGEPCPHLPAVPATHTNCCKLHHPRVETQRCPLRVLQLGAAPFCSDVVGVFQLEVAKWHLASPLHDHFWALLIRLQVGNTRKKGAGVIISILLAACAASSLSASTVKQNCKADMAETRTEVCLEQHTSFCTEKEVLFV